MGDIRIKADEWIGGGMTREMKGARRMDVTDGQHEPDKWLCTSMIEYIGPHQLLHDPHLYIPIWKYLAHHENPTTRLNLPHMEKEVLRSRGLNFKFSP